jgi:hypothetical protein
MQTFASVSKAPILLKNSALPGLGTRDSIL